MENFRQELLMLSQDFSKNFKENHIYERESMAANEYRIAINVYLKFE